MTTKKKVSKKAAAKKTATDKALKKVAVGVVNKLLAAKKKKKLIKRVTALKTDLYMFPLCDSDGAFIGEAYTIKETYDKIMGNKSQVTCGTQAPVMADPNQGVLPLDPSAETTM